MARTITPVAVRNTDTLVDCTGCEKTLIAKHFNYIFGEALCDACVDAEEEDDE